MKIQIKYLIGFFSIFLLLFVTSNIYAYNDQSIRIEMVNTVRSGANFNVQFIVEGGTRNFDYNVYSPAGGSSIANGSGSGTKTVQINATDFEPSANPYLIRAKLKDIDDNPSNDIYYKYFTVIRSEDKTPVSDLPLFSGIFIALIAVAFISFRNSKTKKK